MEPWDIQHIEFDPAVWDAIELFLDVNPNYESMVTERINDLRNFPDLIWASAVIDPLTPNEATFVTNNQQLDLAGKVYRLTHTALIAHFSFHV